MSEALQGRVIWFSGNRRLLGAGAAMLLLGAAMLVGVARSQELAPNDPVRVLMLMLFAFVTLTGVMLVLLPDRLRVTQDRLQLYTSGLIPGRAYRHGAFRGLTVDYPASQVDLEFASGRRIPFFSHKDPFVVYQRAREMSAALSYFVRSGETKLFKDGHPPNRPNFFLQFEELDPKLVRGRYPLPEAERLTDGYRFKLVMARPLPGGQRGLIVTLGPEGLRIQPEGQPLLVDVPLNDVVIVEATRTGYLGILTRDQGLLKLEGIGSPQDRYLVLHLAAAMRQLIKEEKVDDQTE